MNDPQSAASAEEDRREAASADKRSDLSWPLVGTDTAAGLLEAASDAILGIGRPGPVDQKLC